MYKKSSHSKDSWHNGAYIEVLLYARSLQKAAKVLVENLDPNSNPAMAWDAAPLILLYRQAVELHLKALIGEGGNFLPAPTDHITLYTTHSVRWLAQIARQIIKAVGWGDGFKSNGVTNLAEFSALVNQLETLDPVSCVTRSDHRGLSGAVPLPLQKVTLLELAPKLDALLDLLAATADSLAATWDLMEDGETGAGTTIQ